MANTSKEGGTMPLPEPVSGTVQQHEYEAFCRWRDSDGAKRSIDAFYAGLRYAYEVSGRAKGSKE